MSVSEYKNMPRLFVPEGELSIGKNIILPNDQAHYLRNVMRLSPGDALRIFNGMDGEWVGDIKEINKKNVIVSLSEQINEQKSSADIWVLASSVKKEAFEWMIEKASELGASEFYPLEMERTVVHRVNDDRATLIAVEAAEQSERLDILKTHPLQSMTKFLAGWNPARKIVFCLERHEAKPVAEALQSLKPHQPMAVLVGPEGRFSEAEIQRLLKLEYVVPVSLGPRILRAETALCAVLSCVQAQCGDWV